MTKQRPDPHKMANELAGASAFFKRPQAQPVPLPAPAEASSTPTVPTPTPTLPSEPVQPRRTARTPVRPERRQMIRHPFELYMDQLDSLRERAEAQRRRGEPASMSRMVREAIDRYLDAHPLDDES
ncbi:MAG: hypothetical protein ACRDJW_25460 [Thermomicrobiales bacterium]